MHFQIFNISSLLLIRRLFLSIISPLIHYLFITIIRWFLYIRCSSTSEITRNCSRPCHRIVKIYILYTTLSLWDMEIEYIHKLIHIKDIIFFWLLIYALTHIKISSVLCNIKRSELMMFWTNKEINDTKLINVNDHVSSNDEVVVVSLSLFRLLYHYVLWNENRWLNHLLTIVSIHDG